MDKIEARGVIKFHLKGNSARQIHDEMMAVYGDESPSYDTVVRWKRNFQTVHMSLSDEPRSGRPSITDDLDTVKKDEENFFACLMNMDECWVYLYDPKTKEMSKEWKHTPSIKSYSAESCREGNPVEKVRDAEQKARDADEIQQIPRFLLPCNTNNRRTDTAPTSAHALNPLDIKVISTLRSLKIKSTTNGHSVNLFAGLEEALLGASRLTESYVGQRLHDSVSNISPVPQTKLVDEAKKLTESLQQSLTVSFADDWKMILIFVAADDPCGFCGQEDYTQNTMKELTEALDYLHEQMPKTFVSLVDLTVLSGLYLSHPSNAEIRKSCECFENPSDYNKAMLRFSFQAALERLISSERYDTRKDFTVALHPVLHVVDSERNNFNNYGEVYRVQCSAQDTLFLNTHKNSPYMWQKEMMLTEDSGPQPWKIGSNFSCADLSPSDTIPTSVHRLKAGDIKVIAALGDSITAGNGAGAIVIDLLDVVTEYRGLSFSIGGDGDLSNTTTLPNILRQFNPDIQGYSLGRGSHHLPNAMLNRAVPGAKADDMLEQAEYLVRGLKRLSVSGSINYTEDWKLLTIFIGGNDLCGICKNPVYHSPEQFVYRIKQALDYLQQEVPRMFVNLVTILDILPLKALYDDKRTRCPQQIMSSLCGCVVNFTQDTVQIATLKTFNKQYQEKTHQLVESGLYDTTEDFTVVVQPYLEHLEIPLKEDGSPDRSYMAPDCFHFGEAAHAQSARSLWKNMFEPVGQKTDSQALDENIKIECPPQDDPYLKTMKNSNYVYPTITPDPVHGTKLECADRSPSPVKPTSVHALRPGDITVVAAVGDSLTAGNGIGSAPGDVLDVLRQYRGLSWSIGGDSTLKQVTTLPNILLEFNPFVTGYATEIGNSAGHNSFLNEAVPGAKAFDMPSQVRALIDQMSLDQRVNFRNDWKVITMFIGANDLCAACTDSNMFSAVSYISHIQEALDMLYNEVPRAFVNLVEVMDLIPLREAVLDSRVQCPTFITRLLCPCLLNVPENSHEMQVTKDANSAYQQSLQHLVYSGKYDKEDFTVVLQPFFHHTKIPHLPNGTPDVSYLAPDCFHLSQKAHSQLARMLWNNMLEPLGSKTDTMDFVASVPLHCPTQAQPFLRTHKNSDFSYPIQPTPKPVDNWGSDMECYGVMPISDNVPTSVHKLRPGDIKVVAALGDSLTAGFGANATSLLNLAVESRGISWSIGGDEALEKHTTLPNIMKKFNPNLQGFSTGTGSRNQMFNVAVSGAKAENMLSQAQTLLQKMKESSVINFNEDWKLITIFIGGNDLCQYCQNRDRYSLKNHIQHLKNTLDVFYNEIPRVFVNLVEIMEVEGLRKVTSENIGCSLLKPNLCPCFINPRDGSPELNEIKRFNRDLQIQVTALAEKYQGREDFAVVAQPFFKNTVVPVDHLGEPDVSFFSADCFHFSERGHAEMAIALWNNMLEPAGEKQNHNNFTHDRHKLKCPSNDHPFLFTLKNSFPLEDEEPTHNPEPTQKPEPTHKPEPTQKPEPPPGVTVPKDDDQVPYWAVIVASIGGVALGCAVVGIAMSMTYRKRASKQKRLSESGSSF
ncbi:phospholipase B1, membrane-associated-like [Pseudophryne corroboree]|uniref:phospholipase B1, membrane-associated-like n=1 Tax=Pseudophryne corroboree TaxID=495146 RepID=UPI003081D54E